MQGLFRSVHDTTKIPQSGTYMYVWQVTRFGTIAE